MAVKLKLMNYQCFGIFARRDGVKLTKNRNTVTFQAQQGLRGHESGEESLHCQLLILNWDSSYSTVTEMSLTDLKKQEDPHIISDFNNE